MNNAVLKALEEVQVDPKSPANINYAKARYAIEAAAKSRKEKREAKVAVVSLLNGEIVHHQLPAKSNGTTRKDVKFADGTVARF
jgi:hypothetical protein